MSGYRAEHLARRDGLPGDRSINHLAGARNWANDLVEARRPILPIQRFEHRAIITAEQHLAYRRAVLANKERRWSGLQLQTSAACRHLDISHLDISNPSITRPAIAGALRDLGHRKQWAYRFVNPFRGSKPETCALSTLETVSLCVKSQSISSSGISDALVPSYQTWSHILYRYHSPHRSHHKEAS